MLLHRTRHRFSVDDYEELIERGILTEDNRVELIRGEIVDKMSVGDQHAACVKKLNQLFSTLLIGRAVVSIQDPIRLADSEPEPDVALLVQRADFYASGKPETADILVLIEVADSSLDDDRDVKGPIYAENGIADYWIVNLIDRCLEVYRQPQSDGSFANVRTLKPGDSIDVLALPGLTVAVSDIL